MVLYVPGARGSGWDANHSDWDSGVLFAAPSGMTAQSSGTLGAYGATSTLIPALPFDVGHIILEWSQANSSGADNRSEGEILIDRAGGTTWETNPLVPSIPLAGAQASAINQRKMELPLFVPAGASLGIRSRAVASSARTYRFGLTVFARAALPPGYRSGQRAVAIGVNAYPALGGTDVASSGAWVNVGSPLQSDTYGMLLMSGGIASTTMTGSAAHMAQLGVSSTPIWHPQIYDFGTAVEAASPAHRSINCGLVVPAGTQMQVRHSNQAGETYPFTIMGVV